MSTNSKKIFPKFKRGLFDYKVLSLFHVIFVFLLIGPNKYIALFIDGVLVALMSILCFVNFILNSIIL